MHLLVVIGFALDDGAGAVELFGEDEAYHLVGEGEARQGYLLVGTLIDGRGEAVGASDDEDEAPGGLLFLLQPAGQFDAAVLVAVLVEQDDVVGGLQLAQDELTLGGLLLFLGEVLGVAQLGYGDDVEGHVVTDAFGIVADACHEVLIDGLADL